MCAPITVFEESDLTRGMSMGLLAAQGDGTLHGGHIGRTIGLVLASMVVLIGCVRPGVSVIATPLGSERTYPATPDSTTIPLYTTTKLECAYDEIAALTAEGSVALSDAKVLDGLRAKARAVGAHAIIGYSQSTRQSTELEGEIRVRNGTAIRFRSADCMT
jgi:hypothetical protein